MLISFIGKTYIYFKKFVGFYFLALCILFFINLIRVIPLHFTSFTITYLFKILQQKNIILKYFLLQIVFLLYKRFI